METMSIKEYMDAISRKIKECALWAEMWIADFAETGVTRRSDFTVIGIQ
jgi:hypothetical protein